ncbi:MAG: hypothetical protein ACO30K_18060, partial [bacterium]
MSSNRKWILSILMAAVVGWTQVGCMMPEEGTIIYDQGYPEIPDEIEGSGGGGEIVPGSPTISGGDGSGSGSGSSGGTGSGGGSGGRSPESNAGFTVTQSDGSTSVTESGNSDTISIVLDEEPTA